MKFLIYVDPSFRGEWALSPARDIALGLGGTVVLVTTEANHREHPELLDEAASDFEKAETLKVEKHWRPGSAREVILSESREVRPAITVFPPAGRNALTRMIKGSRVKTVVHNTPSTVMVARKPVSGHIQNILVTVRGGPFAETLILCAQEIAHAVKAKISVLHVTSGVTIPFREDEAHEKDRSLPPPAPPHLLELLAKHGLENRVRAREGMVVSEIVAECNEGHYDLLVVGQHLADKEAGGPLSENLAELLTMESPIPVMMVRPRLWITGSGAVSPAGQGSV